MKQVKIFGGICAAVAMLIGAGAAYAELREIGTFTVQRGRDGKDGKDGTSVTIKGTKENCAALPSTGNTVGDIYIVKGNGDNLGYIWDGESFNCPDNGIQIQGLNGCAPRINVSEKNSEGCFNISVTVQDRNINGQCADVGDTITQEVCKGEDAPACQTTVTLAECGPDKTAKCKAATRSGTQVTITDCSGANPQTYDAAYNGQNTCEIVPEADRATTPKTKKEVYVERSGTTRGYYNITTEYCDGNTTETRDWDKCDETPYDSVQTSCPTGQRYMNCTNKSTNQPYSFCEAGEGLYSSIQQAQEDATNAGNKADANKTLIQANTTEINKKLDATEAASTYLNKTDAETTYLNKTDAAATYANKDNVISKDATFSTENGYIVLNDGDTTKNVVALSDIQGESPCPGGFTMTKTGTSEDADTYTVYCNTEKN